MSAVRVNCPSRNLKIVPIKPCCRSGPASTLSFRHTSLYFDEHCNNSLSLPGLFGFSTDWWANTIISGRCLSLRSRPISLWIPFLHLYPLTVDTNFSHLGPFEIITPVSKADPMLSCSCSVGLALVQSTAFPLRTARL